MRTKKTIPLGKGNVKTIYYYNGKLKQIIYRLNNKRHREDGPAVIWYDDTGNIIEEERYYKNGINHREDGPAVIWYNKDGTIEREYYYLNGKYHREDGPADIWYNKDGTIDREIYCLNSKELTKEQFENKMFKKKLELL